ncbi:MAG: hypothetical protein ABIH41_03380 [Nanoarchaeota archaeon]
MPLHRLGEIEGIELTVRIRTHHDVDTMTIPVETYVQCESKRVARNRLQGTHQRALNLRVARIAHRLQVINSRHCNHKHPDGIFWTERVLIITGGLG